MFLLVELVLHYSHSFGLRLVSSQFFGSCFNCSRPTLLTSLPNSVQHPPWPLSFPCCFQVHHLSQRVTLAEVLLVQTSCLLRTMRRAVPVWGWSTFTHLPSLSAPPVHCRQAVICFSAALDTKESHKTEPSSLTLFATTSSRIPALNQQHTFVRVDAVHL